MNHRYRTLGKLLLFVIIFGLAAACSSETPLDPETIDVQVWTEESAVAGKETTLFAELTGAEFPEQTFVQFDVRIDGTPHIVTGTLEGDDVYTATYEFPEAGEYVVYMHIYIDDLHLMMRRQVEIG